MGSFSDVSEGFVSFSGQSLVRPMGGYFGGLNRLLLTSFVFEVKPFRVLLLGGNHRSVPTIFRKLVWFTFLPNNEPFHLIYGVDYIPAPGAVLAD